MIRTMKNKRYFSTKQLHSVKKSLPRLIAGVVVDCSTGLEGGVGKLMKAALRGNNHYPVMPSGYLPRQTTMLQKNKIKIKDGESTAS